MAHAFLPRRGEAHFDRDERWSLSRRRGRNLFVVLAHEIGHTLGLTHSAAPRALMAPYYKRLGRDALLSWDDVLAVDIRLGKYTCFSSGLLVRMAELSPGPGRSCLSAPRPPLLTASPTHPQAHLGRQPSGLCPLLSSSIRQTLLAMVGWTEGPRGREGGQAEAILGQPRRRFLEFYQHSPVGSGTLFPSHRTLRDGMFTVSALTSLAPHERLPEILVVPREKTPTGAAARGNP